MAKGVNDKFSIVWRFLRSIGLLADTTATDMPVGGLYVTGAETGGMNIRSVGKGLNLSNSIEPVYGNTYVYTPDAPVAQNKLWRLYVDTTAVTLGTDITYSLAVNTPSGTVIITSSTTVTVNALADVLTSITTVLSVSYAILTPVTSTTTVTATTGYVDVEFQAAPYFNYEFTAEVTDGLAEFSLVVTQESVDPSMVGEWHLIGSNDRIGDCFQFWTTRYGLPDAMNITDVTNPAATTIRITVNDTTGLVDGQSVLIQSVDGVPNANGEWMITNITATTFDLILSAFGGAYVSGGTVTTNIYGLGEIGVASQDNSGVTSYVRLLRSNELNFSTLKQIDVRSKRKQDSFLAVPFTDNFNPPRLFYYKGAFQTDGAIFFINPDGQYNYGSIAQDILLFISTAGFGIKWFDQVQVGGAVKSGNWRYAVRFLTSTLAPSQWSQITDVVPVASANILGDPNVMWGDDENIPTPKSNVLEITNAIPGLFKFCEIAAINYIGSSFTGLIIGRYLLDGSPIQYITHTGNENAAVDLDLGELGAVLPPVGLAQNNEFMDGRLVLSNLTPAPVIDFTPWVETFQYSIDRDRVNPVGVYNNDNNGLNIEEYQLPTNVYNYKSHMMYETYRYGFKFRLRASGHITPVFYPGYDIKIDLPAVLPPERIAGTFTSFDLTDIDGPPDDVYTIYINWQNIDLSFLIDGIPAHQLIDQIIPCRVEVVPTVLGHGIVILGMSGENTVPGSDGSYIYSQSLDPTVIGPFGYVSGYINSSSPNNIATTDNPEYNAQTIGAPYEDPERASVFFYSPDLSFGLTSFDFSPNDQLISFGAPVRHDEFNDLPGGLGVTLLDVNYAEYNGYTNITANPTPEVINDAVFAGTGETGITVDGKEHSLIYWFFDDTSGLGPIPRGFKIDQCFVIGLNADLLNTSANNDYGLYRAIYYRPLSNQYGDPITSIYTEFRTPHNINDETGVIAPGDLTSYGDVFTQKTYLKQRYPGKLQPTTPNLNAGFGIGIGYYSQNRGNIQMRRKPTPTYNDSAIVPNLPIEDWLRVAENETATTVEMWMNGRDAQYFYNRGYTPRNNVTSTEAFDSTANYQVDWGNFIIWSEPDVPGSSTDYNRIFLPLSIKALDYTFGSITDARDINGLFVTIQSSRVVRQYFNTTELSVTELGSEVILGSGDVMRREGQVLTTFGSQHKWSVIVAKSDKGFDVLYFVDAINKTVCRYGYNGNDAIDEIDGMKSFFANHLQWIQGKYTPAHDQGIHGVSNQRYREVLWTFRGWYEDAEAWDSVTAYSRGDLVMISPGTNVFEQTPDFYIAEVDNTNSEPSLLNTDWTWIPHTNPDYYSEFTICYDALGSRFMSFHTPKPKIYAKFRNTYLVPRPISDTGRMYIADTGLPTAWFAGSSPSEQGDAFFDAVINQPMGRKRFLAVRVDADTAPDRMEVTTMSQTTFSTVSEFLQRPTGEFDTYIRNDTTGTGIATGDSSSMFGQWAIIRYIISPTNYNKINSFVCKVRSLARLYNR